jgi:hypothetical protein
MERPGVEESLSIVIADTSVLINFLAIDRMDLIQRHSCRFFITDHVRHEVTTHYSEQVSRLDLALEQGILEEIQVTDPDEVETFARWTGLQRFGNGECACIAVALHRQFTLAMDDKQAIKHARRSCETLDILTTQDLMLSMIKEDLLGIAEADAIKHDWGSCHRFQLKITSFGDLL